MILRLRFWLALLGTAASQWLNVATLGPRFVLIGGISPDPDETLSAVTGRMAAAGSRGWQALEWIIDRLALPLEGWRLGHCRRAAALFAARCVADEHF
jgi:hypothetical protein